MAKSEERLAPDDLSSVLQSSVLSPILFNIYTNDQPLHDGTRNIDYADDICVTAQYPSFTDVEHTIEEEQDELTVYYRSNSLRANPDKTKVTAFHLKNREAKRTLEVKWNNTDLENTSPSEVPWCHLGQNSELQTHIHNTQMKVATRNNLLKKLSNSKWGSNAITIRITALALSYSAAEYACHVWARSLHASKLAPILNDTCRSITRMSEAKQCRRTIPACGDCTT